MGNVYANGKEVSGKATPNKSIAAFPDVCMSPPSPPAGPIPLPYPLTSMASKTEDGSGSVKIKGKEVGKKNGSVYSKNNGNEPATRNFGADLVSHTITAKTKFEAYSFDVLFEKGGAERFMDLTTGNHANPSAAAPTGSMAGESGGDGGGDDCATMQAQNRDDFDAAKAAGTGTTTKKLARARSDDQAGITIAQASVPGGEMRSGTSSAAVRELVPKFREPPNKPLNGEKQRTTVDGKGRYAMNVCSENGEAPDYHHPTGMEHAEIHIFNSVAGLGGPGRPQITFAIEWRKSFKGKLTEVRQDACPVCQKAIEHACACFSIYICNEENEPEPQCPQDQPAQPSAEPA